MNTQASSTAANAAGLLYVGIDVAKDKLDLARDEAGPVQTFTNDPRGIAQVIELFNAVKPAMIVIEATGGLERRCSTPCWKRSCPPHWSIPVACDTLPKDSASCPKPIVSMPVSCADSGNWQHRVSRKNAAKTRRNSKPWWSADDS